MYCNCLVVIVRTGGFELQAVAHEHSIKSGRLLNLDGIVSPFGLAPGVWIEVPPRTTSFTRLPSCSPGVYRITRPPEKWVISKAPFDPSNPSGVRKSKLKGAESARRQLVRPP